MNKVRNRIAILAGSSVIITILIVMSVFNITVRHKTKRDAYNSLNILKASSEQQNNVPDSIYNPETIIILKDDSDESVLNNFNTAKEKKIIKWCDSNKSSDIIRTTIDGSIFYILKIDSEDINANSVFSDPFVTGNYIISDTDSQEEYGISISYSGDIKSIIGYVDITGEMDMIRQINFFFILTALLIGTLSTISGYFIGRKLEQNQLAQKQFFENTSHELKTPLTAIQGYAEGIEKGVITDLPKTGRVITAQTEKMSRMIEEILCIARIESGAVKLEKETVALDDLIQDCLMPFEGTVQNKGLDVRLELSEQKVSADVEKLEHAVSNLFINAIKYAKTQISISCSSKKLCISNDCSPISNDSLKHIFDRFYTGRDGNTGIGLSLAKEIIELHGWRIYAKSIRDGIMFTIEFEQA